MNGLSLNVLMLAGLSRHVVAKNTAPIHFSAIEEGLGPVGGFEPIDFLSTPQGVLDGRSVSGRTLVALVKDTINAQPFRQRYRTGNILRLAAKAVFSLGFATRSAAFQLDWQHFMQPQIQSAQLQAMLYEKCTAPHANQAQESARLIQSLRNQGYLSNEYYCPREALYRCHLTPKALAALAQ